MMRTMLFAILLVGLQFGTGLAQEPLKPNSLLSWLSIIELEDYQLVSACDQNGFYFAIKIDSDGDVLLANYEHSKAPANRRNPRSFSQHVTDAKGNKLFDWDSKKKNPESKKIKYSSKTQIGPSNISKSATVAYLTGTVYPVKKHSSKRINIQYIEDLGEGNSKVLLDRWIALPQRNAK